MKAFGKLKEKEQERDPRNILFNNLLDQELPSRKRREKAVLGEDY